MGTLVTTRRGGESLRFHCGGETARLAVVTASRSRLVVSLDGGPPETLRPDEEVFFPLGPHVVAVRFAGWRGREGCHGSGARIGVVAPADVRVVRGELGGLGAA